MTLHEDPGVSSRLECYVDLVLEANARAGLTGARTRDALAEQVLDALALAPYAAGPLVDVGSGGGLPGIPLAIATGAAVTLVEATAKKARFLERALAALGLEGLVVTERAEVAARDPALRERFRTATARALGTLPTCLELTVPFLEIGGRALLQRGALEPHERVAASDAALMLGAEAASEVPAGQTRLVAIFEKRMATPPRFPRRNGVPSKRPLCLDVRAGARTARSDA